MTRKHMRSTFQHASFPTLFPDSQGSRFKCKPPSPHTIWCTYALASKHPYSCWTQSSQKYHPFIAATDKGIRIKDSHIEKTDSYQLVVGTKCQERTLYGPVLQRIPTPWKTSMNTASFTKTKGLHGKHCHSQASTLALHIFQTSLPTF